MELWPAGLNKRVPKVSVVAESFSARQLGRGKMTARYHCNKPCRAVAGELSVDLDDRSAVIIRPEKLARTLVPDATLRFTIPRRIAIAVRRALRAPKLIYYPAGSVSIEVADQFGYLASNYTMKSLRP